MLFTNNILYRNVRVLERLIDDYDQGEIRIIIFDKGPCSRGPFKGVSDAFNVRNPTDPIKSDLKRMIDPVRNGAYSKAKDWHGIFIDTVLNGSGPTYINKTCMLAMDIFAAAVKRPGYTNITHSQQLLLFTDGEELERDKTFPDVLARFQLQRNSIWFEYKEIYLGGRLSERQGKFMRDSPKPAFPLCIQISGGTSVSLSAPPVALWAKSHCRERQQAHRTPRFAWNPQ